MQYRKFGNLDGVEVSALGFGCMRLPVVSREEKDVIDEDRAVAMVRHAIDQGVNYIDTAYPYHEGQSERVVGKALKDGYREKVYLATKCPVWMLKKQEDFDQYLEEQLEKLGVEYVDFYLLHALNEQREETLLQWDLFSAAQQFKQEGKIRFLGFSFHDEYPVFERLIDRADWDFCQLQLNYMDTDVQAGMRGYELAAKKGIPVMVMEPVKGGSLANPPEDVKKVFQTLHPDWSGASWALRWVASLENVAVILSGMSNLEQVKDNLQTFGKIAPLIQEEQDAVRRAAEIYRARVRVACTGCAYCMPCPAGVNIPEVFQIYNHAAIYDMPEQGRKSYSEMADEQKAVHCVKCGKCMKACPQNIAIPEKMTEITQWAKG